MKIKKQVSQGFTIVELAAVIFIIAVLSVLMFVSYSSTRGKATATSLQSDLSNASDRLVIEQTNSTTDDFPASLPSSINFGGNTTTNYAVNNASNPKTFCLTATKDSQSYFITQEGLPQPGICPVLYLDASVGTSYPGSGEDWFDLSGCGHNAQACDCLYSSEDGRAITFNGTTSYARVADPVSGRLDFGTGSFSIEAWIKFSSYGGEYKNLIYKGAPSGLSGWRFGVNTSGIPHFLIGDTVSYKEGPLGSTPLSLSTWHHLVIVYNRSSNAVGYVDGVNVGVSDISTKNGSVNNSDQIHIGESYTRYAGQIGIVYIRDVAMSDDDVKKSFEAVRSRYGI